MKNKKALLSLMCVAPLLMANSPAPYPTRETYKDIDVTITKVEDLVDNTTRYQLEIENTGKLYGIIDYNYIDLSYGDTGSTSLYIHRQSLFNDELLAPGQSKVYLTETPFKLDKIESPKWSISTYAYPDENVTFSNFVVTESKSTGYYITYDVKNLGDYYYTYIVDITYDGADYSFEVSDSSNYFYSVQKLDLSKLQVKSMHAFRSSYNTYKGGGYYYQTPEAPLFIVLIATGLVILLAAAITIPCVVAYKKKQARQCKSQDK